MRSAPVLARTRQRIDKTKEELRAQSKGVFQLIELPKGIETFYDLCASIVTRTGDGLKSIELYLWQVGLVESVIKNPSTIITKSRQVGGTTVLLVFALWKCITVPGYLALFVSYKGADALILGQRFKRLVDSLDWLKPHIESDALGNPRFLNQSAVVFRSAEPPDSVGRSLEAVNLAVYDEFSKYLDQEGVLMSTAACQVQVTDPRVVYVSTPNGRSDRYWALLTQFVGEQKFEEILDRIREGLLSPFHELDVVNGVAVLIAYWKCIPKFIEEPDFLGRIKTQFSLTDEAIAQEYQLSFEQSDSTVYSLISVNAATIQDEWKEPPEDDGVYFIGIDPVGVATGKKSDYCAAIVLKKEWTAEKDVYRVIETYHKKSGRQTSEVMISAISDLIRKYSPIKVVCEKNAMGVVWAETLTTLNLGCEIESFVATNQSKEMASGRLSICLESEQMKIPKAIANELLSYRRVPSVTGNSSTLEASKGSHDDLHDGLAMALLASGYSPLKESGLFG